MHRIFHFLSKKEGLFILFVTLVGGAAVLINFSFAATSSSLYPIADGYYRQWNTKNNVSKHYTMVDEITCNGTKDYVYTFTSDLQESYLVNLNSVPNGSEITDIYIVPCASLMTSQGYGSSNLNVFYRFNGIQSENRGNYTLSGAIPKNLSTTRFGGLKFVKNVSSTLEIGAVFSGFGKKGVMLSRMSTRLTWRTPESAPTSSPTTTAQANLHVTFIPDGTPAQGIRGSDVTIAKISITNSTAGTIGREALIKSLNFSVSSTIDNSRTSTSTRRYLRVYKDFVDISNLVSMTSNYASGNQNFGDTLITEGEFMDVSISPGASRVFVITLDTQDARSGDWVSFGMATDDVLWNNGISDITSVSSGLPITPRFVHFE